MRSSTLPAAIVLALLAASLSPALAEGPDVTSDGGVQLASGDAVGGRKLLGKTLKSYTINWSPRGYSPLKVPAGTVVVFKFGKGCGVGYGAGRCSYKGTFAKNSKGNGQISVKIPKGSTWFSDPSSNNCGRGAAILITGT